jgi:hypothetical protein
MDARDSIVEDVRAWREELMQELEGMDQEEAMQYLHRRSEEIKSASSLHLPSAPASASRERAPVPEKPLE